MTPTDLNLFFVQEMLQPEDTRGWTNYLACCRVRVRIDPEQQRECFNWSNTQPLFVNENRQKGSRV